MAKQTLNTKPADKDASQIELLKIIVEDLINKQSVVIIDLLAGKKNVNEFHIAEKLGLTINQTRNILYKLSDYGLVSFTRKKDKRKGWYIYFWELNTHQSLILLKEKLEKKIEVLESQLKNRRESRYYLCETCSIEVDEENALLNNFVCPECENVYILSESGEIIKNIEKNIVKLKKEVGFVNEEVQKHQVKRAKQKVRKIAREEKVKVEKRRKAHQERMKLKGKLPKVIKKTTDTRIKKKIKKKK
ncbi:hypothetical protein J4456_01665 [Candidatus Pacearchaeota archaeon]|nr:hypothetical protein [Candidatus Pacearchaeota archaeon]